ncbi:hypothetical protein K0B96_06540 [Horticoccus luteus]|uniref:Uncharacterized protein n=1 Tax=Horticoccus luteus TaxID=2862869 RepID=A0A8F9TZA8_9BACT|nr:hypothetical protein [Horticoccus luteus]QYM80267.1 hypothetical protein K0B96_06540 [Horticoccus luteus]
MADSLGGAFPRRVAAVSGSINLLPTVAKYAKARAEQLGVTPSLLLRLLLQNYLYGPPLGLPPHLGKRDRLKRQPVQCSLPGSLRRAGKAAAKRWKMSFSELMESLLAADADRGEDTLRIFPPHKKPKPDTEIQL